MDNIERNINNSNERISFYQLFINLKLQIEIPIIQRDYAQGRESEKEIRTSFLQALYDYLQAGDPFRDLDFVYGTILKGKEVNNGAASRDTLSRFIPLDGQQRLTTLFLLHWYLAQISCNSESFRQILSLNGQSLFTYQTRASSREFCDALVKNDIDFNKLVMNEINVKSLGSTIQDRAWFYLSWANDPTIRAMLTMLDAIHTKFDGCAGFFDKLVNLKKPVITFRFLNLQEFNLTDDLYIKMNARGKPLSHFENFKAQLEKTIKHYQGEWPNYKLKFKNTSVSGYEYFIHKIDTDWADIFWAYRNEDTSDNTFDDELMNFIALVIANFQILRIDIDPSDSVKSRVSLFGQGGKLNRLSFVEYEENGYLSQTLIIHLIEIFDLLKIENESNGRLKHYLIPNSYYLEEKIFIKVLTNNTSYPEKLRFFAFFAGLSKGMSKEDLLKSMRIIFNLTENTIFNDVEEYYRALRVIKDLFDHDLSIHDQLKQDVQISTFIEAQVFEEKIKAHLIDISPEWLNAILEAEKHPFFMGQIGFILKFSGIVDLYTNYKIINGDQFSQQFFRKFESYVEAASAVFECIKDDSKCINYAWERAVLTKGDYLTSSSDSRFNLLSVRLTKNNIERDHSWKRLLRFSTKQNESWTKRQSYVQKVLDDSNFDKNNIQASLEIICNKSINDSLNKDWRFMLISKPALFDICNQGFIEINDDEIVLLHQSQRNHYQSEMYSLFLYLDLKERKFSHTPFRKFTYEPTRNGDDYTYIELSEFSYFGNQYGLEVWYELGKFSLVMYNQTHELSHQSILKILKNNEFISIQDLDKDTAESLSEYKNGFFFQCELVSQTYDKLVRLCQELSSCELEI